MAGFWHTSPQTISGKKAPVHFTRDELHWEPWLAAKPLAEFTPDEQALLAKFGHSDSPYFRLLARNLPLLEQRTLTDKGIFYTPGGPAARRARAGGNGGEQNQRLYLLRLGACAQSGTAGQR